MKNQSKAGLLTYFLAFTFFLVSLAPAVLGGSSGRPIASSGANGDITSATAMTSASSLAAVGTITSGQWNEGTASVNKAWTAYTTAGHPTIGASDPDFIRYTATSGATITFDAVSGCNGKPFTIWNNTGGNLNFAVTGGDTFTFNNSSSPTGVALVNGEVMTLIGYSATSRWKMLCSSSAHADTSNGLVGSVPIANGGTAGTSAATARSNLGAAASGANSDITSLTAGSGGLTIGAPSSDNISLILSNQGTSYTSDILDIKSRWGPATTTIVNFVGDLKQYADLYTYAATHVYGSSFDSVPSLTFTQNSTGIVLPRGATLLDSGTNAATLTGALTVDKHAGNSGVALNVIGSNSSADIVDFVYGADGSTVLMYMDYGGNFHGSGGTVLKAGAGNSTLAGLGLNGSGGGNFDCETTTFFTSGLTLNPQTAPSSPSAGWIIYCDSGDSNKLKAKASNGTVATLATP